MRARERNPDARLQDPVAAHDATEVGVVHGTVERVRQGSHEERRRVRRKDGVGVQGDHIAHAPHRLEVADHHAEPVAGAGQDEAVELGELAALPLPSHPDALVRVPAARAVEQVERVLAAAAVAGVEGADPVDRGGHDRLVAFAGLAGRVGEVAQHREMEVRLAVGQELHLEILERLVHGVHAPEQRRDDDRGAELGRARRARAGRAWEAGAAAGRR